MLVAIEKKDNNNINPIDEYKLFITDELLTLLVTETNRLSQSVIDGAQLTCRSRLQRHRYNRELEMKLFLGLLLYMGIVVKPELYHYWSRNVMYVIFIVYLLFLP